MLISRVWKALSSIQDQTPHKGRKIKETIRDRYLTEEEASKYRRIRELVAEELPETSP